MAPTELQGGGSYSQELVDCVNSLVVLYGGDDNKGRQLPILQKLVVTMVRQGKGMHYGEIVQGVRKLFASTAHYELHLLLRDYHETFTETEKGDRLKTTLYSVTDVQACRVLQEYLCPKLFNPGTRCPFLSIPPEIRLIIYELLLVGPKSGVMMWLSSRRGGLNDRRRLALTSTRDPNTPVRFDTLTHYSDPASTSDMNAAYSAFNISHSDRESLLRTCKQVAHEATPIFYGKNHFFGKNIGAAHRTFVTAMPAIGMPLLRKVSFAWETYYKEYAASLIRALRSSGVVELGIRIEKEWWTGFLGQMDGAGHLKHSTIKRMPGVTTLLANLGDGDKGKHSTNGKKAKRSKQNKGKQEEKTEEDEQSAEDGPKPQPQPVPKQKQFRKIFFQGNWSEFAAYVREHSDVPTVEYKGQKLCTAPKKSAGRKHKRTNA